MKRAFLSLSAAVCLVASALAQQPQTAQPAQTVRQPRPAQQSQPARSRTETKTVRSAVLNADRSYTVYLPAGYDQNPDKTYPVLYLLHGLSGDHTNWFERGHLRDVADQLIASGEACPMIIVSPEAGGRVNEAWNGYFNMPGWSYETFFFAEFMPLIEREYRVVGDKSCRAVAGLSMGGGGATKYAQHHPDMFSSVYAMSALMTLPESGGPASSDNPDDMLSHLNRSVLANSCIDCVRNADETQKDRLRTVAWYVDCGDDDFLLDRNIEFSQAMRAAGIPLQFRVRDGGHTWEYWHSALYSCLPFVSRNFCRDTGGI